MNVQIQKSEKSNYEIPFVEKLHLHYVSNILSICYAIRIDIGIGNP